MKRAIRNLIIGEDIYIESRNEFRQVMLSGQYALLSILVMLTFMALDFRYSSELIVFSMAICLLITSLVLHRFGHHCTANFFLFPTINIVLFLMATSESITTCAMIFFIPISLGSLAVFNYKGRKIAGAFALLSFALFIVTIISDYSFLPFRNYSEADLRLFRMINFICAFVSSIMTVYLLISLNHHSTSQLVYGNKQLTKLNAELDRFVYSTSHDLRAPLLSIRGLLKLAENAPEPDVVKNYHVIMENRLLSLDRFIKSITDYSRNNRLEIVKEMVNLAVLANDVWESLRYTADAQDIEFINDLPEDLVVVNDHARLRVVLSNLIANAIRYHDHRKNQKHIRVYHHVTDTSFTLHIEDNGQGIAPELHAKIFEMFFRGNQSSQGSGLGLYIVKETLNRMSGSIELSSVPRQGSTFSISLPQ